MPQSLHYILEKLGVATQALASGEGTLQERLHAAFVSGLSRMSSRGMPAEIHAEWDEFEAALTNSVPSSNEEKAIAEALRQMDSHKASILATKIVQMLIAVAQADARKEVLDQLRHLDPSTMAAMVRDERK